MDAAAAAIERDVEASVRILVRRRCEQAAAGALFFPVFVRPPLSRRLSRFASLTQSRRGAGAGVGGYDWSFAGFKAEWRRLRLSSLHALLWHAEDDEKNAENYQLLFGVCLCASPFIARSGGACGFLRAPRTRHPRAAFLSPSLASSSARSVPEPPRARA